MDSVITWLIIFILCNSSTSSSIHENRTNIAHIFTRNKCAQPIKCQYVPKDKVISQSKECCNNLTKTFECSWATDYFYISRYFQTLRSWNCSENLKQECQNRTFALTDYTKNLYLSFCNHSQFEEKCFSKVKSVLKNKKNLTWDLAVSMIKTSELSKNEVLDPCIQVAVSEVSKPENFVEIFKFNYFGCLAVWAGLNASDDKSLHLEYYDLTDSTCKNGIITGLVFEILGSVIGSILNIFVLAVIFFSPSLRHTQFIYKASIAISDVILSLFVFPSIFYNTHKQVFRLLNIYEINFPINESQNITISTSDKAYKFNSVYLNISGMSASLVVFASFYTLILAAWDRLYAVSSPLKYRQTQTRKKSIRLALIVWLIAFIVSLLPVVVGPSLYYRSKNRALSSMQGSLASLVLITCFALPIPLMWTLSILTFWKTLQHTKKGKKLVAKKSLTQSSLEIRLAKNLLIMVGAFTVSIMPMFILLIVELSIPISALTSPRTVNFNYLYNYFTVEKVSIGFMLSNTILNIIIYNAQNLEFRKGFFSLLRKISRSHGKNWFQAKPKTQASYNTGITNVNIPMASIISKTDVN